MKLLKKLNNKRGLTLAELLIVVAIIAVFASIAVTFIKPQDISYTEYNRSAEAIATAVQNRLTEIRNSGDMSTLRRLGEQSTESAATAQTAKAAASSEGDTFGGPLGGYRYVFNYNDDGGSIEKNSLISYILPFGAIDYELAQNYYAVGFQSDTGMVGEVFYSTKPFATHSTSYLLTLSGDSEQAKQKRKDENVGYYQGTVYEEEVAFANLPTPQLTITNHEELSLSIYLPEVKQLNDYGKKLGILLSLSDEDGEAYGEGGLNFNQTAIYSTFSLGSSDEIDTRLQPVVYEQEISSGATYKIVLDTVKACSDADMDKPLTTPPAQKFEQWAIKSGAFKKEYLKLGDNAVITATVYCLDTADGTPDPTYMPRSASLTFNGWFNNYKSGTVDIACGRHLQNLANLTEMRPNLVKYLPKVTKTAEGYTYGDYSYGSASAYTYESSEAGTSSKDVSRKYQFREGVKSSIKYANQVNAIDFACAEWKDIAFTPICLPEGFTYYGNYLTINYLNVDAPFYAGLFGYAYKATLYDILLVNPHVESHAPAHLAELYEMGVGALIGTSRDSNHINNCQTYMTPDKDGYDFEKYRVTGECYVGGLIGFCEDEHIENCSASVCTGYAEGATKTVETNTGTKTSAVSSRYVGGLIGCITGDSKIQDCYAAGNLSGEHVGGLVGYIVEDSDPSGDDYRIETCYTAGHIEYASVEAAGILGYISELAGNAKSALSVYGNYCVIIYGKKSGTASDYEWTCKLPDGKPVPIYGTFKGDGFEWLRTDDLDFSDTYFKGKYAGDTFFAGAVFENNNKNYFIRQRGITYANSPYFTSVSEGTKALTDYINANKGKLSSTELKSKVEDAQNKVFWLKKIQALEELKIFMERIIYEVDNETGYNKGGYYGHKDNIYLDLSRARVEGVNNEKGHSYSDKLTLTQALHAMYDGTYTEGNVKKEVTMFYEGDTQNKKDLKTYVSNYTFMEYYDLLKKTYTTLAGDASAEEEKKAQEVLKLIFGDNTQETYWTYWTVNGVEQLVERPFYEAGVFYQCFYSDLLYRLFDKAKDYYQEDLKDKNGELVYRYFRGLASGKFLELICDLGMSKEEREEMLLNIKINGITEAKTTLTGYKDIIAKWNGPMKSYQATATEYVENSIKALGNLLDGLSKSTPEQLQQLQEAAENALKPLYQLLYDHKSSDEEKDPGDWDAVDAQGTKGDMRKLRDPVLEYRRTVALCSATANSGVENALDVLAAKLSGSGADIEKSAEEFTEKINMYINNDSGHALKNSEEIRNAARGFADGNASGTREETLGFMYNYGNKYTSHNKDINPYTNSGRPISGSSYVDKDNGIYNNVFPYTENPYTSYFPFPFVFAREVENGERVLYVLFHYGDWLTEDLWADDTVSAVVKEANYYMNSLTNYLQTVSANNKDTIGNLKNDVEPLTSAINTCVENVNSVLDKKDSASRNRELKSIGEKINGWLAKNGLFSKLEKTCENAQSQGSEEKRNFAIEVSKMLSDYRSRLEKLIERINNVIGQ